MKNSNKQYHIGLQKIDFIYAAIIGEACFILLLAIISALSSTSSFTLPALLPLSPHSLVVLAFLFPITVAVGLLISQYGTYFIRELTKIAKFALVGALNTLLDIGTFAMLASLAVTGGSIVFPLIKIVSFLVANTNSFLWNKYWVFAHEKEKQRITLSEIRSFILVSVGGLLINVISFVLLGTLLEYFVVLPIIVSGVVSALLAALASLTWNFVGYKIFVFKEKPS